MPNEMRRPCTLPASWKQPNGRPIEPFDAIGATVLPSGRDMGVYTKDGRVIRFEFATREALEIGYMEAITTIAQALNPPIKVSKLVLKAMEKVPEAKFWVWDDESKYLLEWQGVWEYDSKNDSWQNGRDFDDEGIPSHSKLQLGDYIQADCPLALQVLFQFNTEGELLCLTK